MSSRRAQTAAVSEPIAGGEPVTLPRGPHKLSREEVVRSQRARLMRAMAEATSENGYVETSVADVLRRAKVSRETFYQQFASKQDCFIAAYEQAAGAILALLETVAAGDGPPLERFARTIEVYLQALAAEPAFARLFMVEVYAAGDEVLEHRAQIQERVEQLMIDGFGARTETESFACRALVAAIITMVTARLAERDADGIKGLREPLIDLVRAALERVGERRQS
jgi:AcrR family transcriptional regulator